MKGKSISVCAVDDNFDLGLFGGLANALNGHVVLTEVNIQLLVSLRMWVTRATSKSLPPRRVSPLVDLTCFILFVWCYRCSVITTA